MDSQEQKPVKPAKGLIHVYTGDGKGKSTAALGVSLRMIGHERKVCVIQFIKGTWHYGELDSIRKYLSPLMEIIPAGKGFVGILDDTLPREEHAAAARAALQLAREKIHSGEYGLVVLDEIHVAVKLGLINVDEVLEIIDKKPDSVHLILTGRDAKKEIIDRADLVTEMRLIKHYFNKGIGAVRGMEY